MSLKWMLTGGEPLPLSKREDPKYPDENKKCRHWQADIYAWDDNVVHDISLFKDPYDISLLVLVMKQSMRLWCMPEKDTLALVTAVQSSYEYILTGIGRNKMAEGEARLVYSPCNVVHQLLVEEGVTIILNIGVSKRWVRGGVFNNEQIQHFLKQVNSDSSDGCQLPAVLSPDGMKKRLSKIRYGIGWVDVESESVQLVKDYFGALAAKYKKQYVCAEDVARVENAIAYVKEHENERVWMDDLCDRAGCSENTLRKSFLGVMGINPSLYVAEKVVRFSVLMLLANKGFISSVVKKESKHTLDNTGYLIKARLGIPPRDIRKLHWNLLVLYRLI